MNQQKLLDTAEVTDLFGLTNAYLRKLRSLRKGPKYVKIGRMIRYRMQDVQEWLDKVIVEVKPKAII